MKNLVVGLGNIGQEYENSRHNIGFMMVDRVAQFVGATWSDHERYGSIARGRIKNQEILLLKPSTYMNLSGDAVRYYAEKENIAVERILVLVDDLALPLGTLRLRSKGSAGGHNGLKHIEYRMGSGNYPRLRFGIGNNYAHGAQVDFVLGDFTTEERPVVDEKLREVPYIVQDALLSGITFAQNNIGKERK